MHFSFVSLRRKCMKNYLNKLTQKGLTTNRTFGSLSSRFLQIKVS